MGVAGLAGPKFELFLPERVEVSAIVEPLGWERRAGTGGLDCFGRAGRDWDAYIYEATPMSWEDAPPEAAALQAGIAWHVEAGLDGSETGLPKVLRALRAIAKAGHGVIADDSDVWRPGSSQRTRWSFPTSPLASETAMVRMAWWMVDPAITTEDGASAFVETLSRVLPEAMPARWGDFEPLSHTFDGEGPEALARFISSHRDEVITKVRPPFGSLTFTKCGPLVRTPSVEGMRSLTVECGASVLDQPGWRRQLPVAFTALSRVLRPFYGEARLVQQDVAHLPPTDAHYWWGFPRIAPLAMVIGAPYVEHWTTPGGHHVDDLIFYGADTWPELPRDDVPVADEGLLQEFDPYWASTERLGRHIRVPEKHPPTWPFWRLRW